MTDATKLEVLDVDGAIRETAHDAMETLEAEGDTRLDFFKKAGIAGGAAMGSGAVLSALVPGVAMAANGAPPAAIFGKGDVGILQFALQLEYLESAFYNEATKNQAKSRFLKTKQLQVFLKTVTKDEAFHVKFLKTGLGSAALPPPKFDFGGDTSNAKQFIIKSKTFENEGVHAYLGQAGNLQSPKFLGAAASILTIEARHAAVIGFIAATTETGITPDGPLDVPFTANKVLSDVKGLHYIKSGPLKS